MKKVLIQLALFMLVAVGVDVCAQPDPCGVPVAVTPSAPFFEDFESGQLLECWTQQGNQGMWSRVRGDAFSGDWYLEHGQDYIFEYGDVAIITPWLDVSAIPDCKLIFMQHRGVYHGSCDSLAVLYRTQNSNEWQRLAVFGDTMAQWTETVVDLPAGAAVCQLGFLGIRTGYVSGSRLDDIYVGPSLECTRVQNPAVLSVGPDSVVLGWHPASGNNIEYHVDWWCAMNDTMHAVTTDTIITLRGLGGGTLYYFKVTTQCGATEGPLPYYHRLRTESSVVHVPYFESFNGLVNRFPPGWELLEGVMNEDGSYSDLVIWPPYIYLWGSSDVMIALPPTDRPTDSLQIKFDFETYHPVKSDYATSISVGYMTDVADSNTYVDVVKWNIDELNVDQEIVASMVGVPDSARVVLRYRRSAYSVSGCHIGNILIDTLPACLRPNYVHFFSTDETIRVTVVSGFSEMYRVVWSRDSVSDSADFTGTQFFIRGLIPGTEYSLKLSALCGNGSATTPILRKIHTTGECPVGIDVADGTAFALFPNPASGRVTLVLSGFDGEVTVEIVDMNGRTVTKHSTLNTEYSIDLSRVAKGAYFVRVTGSNQSVVRKLMVR